MKQSHLDVNSKGIKAAVAVIVEIAMRDKKITDDQINTVLASMLCGELVTSNSLKAKKVLMRATQIDRDFVHTAIITSKKTKHLGGEQEEMEHAAASVLACRNIRKKWRFIETAFDNMSEYIAKETIALMEEEENDSDDYDSEIDDSLLRIANRLKLSKKKEVAKKTESKHIKVEDNSTLQQGHVKNVAQTITCALIDRSEKLWNGNFIDFHCGTN